MIVRLGQMAVNGALPRRVLTVYNPPAPRSKRSYNGATSLPSAACLPTFEADSLPDRKTMPRRAR